MRSRPHIAFALLLALAGCTAFEPPEDVEPAGACCDGRGTCLPDALVETRYREFLGDQGCSEETLCVPDQLQSGDAPAECTVSLTGAEGRCLPACLPSVQTQERALERDGCAQFERCVPCYDPRSGALTGACGVNDDPGPTDPPVVFGSCCDNVGLCVPEPALDPADAELLGPDTCLEAGSLCVPREALDDPESYAPAQCTVSTIDAEGRCLAACLPAIAAQADQLSRDGCEDGFLCAPCHDPISGEESGACEFGADPGPERAATTFPDCCGDEGRCVPPSLVDRRAAAQLGSGSCDDSDRVCVPEPFLDDPSHVPMSCTVSAFGAEGRCLHACIPAVAEQADRLRADGCPRGQLCSPCFDPISGAATGSCELGDDPGPSQAPIEFASCCGGLARCVPEDLLAEADAARLGRDRCSGSQELCVPAAFLDDDDYAPDACTVGATESEGRCLPACLPEVAAQSDRLSQDGCDTGHLCVPCFDPLSGEATGGCEFGSDPGPDGEGVVFADCCGGQARCLPEDLVPGERRDLLGGDGCSGAAELCVPSDFIEDEAFVAESCEVSAIGAEGRCQLACLPAVAGASADVLEREGCGEGRVCVPCYDPIRGDRTGACDVAPDPGPESAAVVLSDCCEGLGRCAPQAWVPQAFADLLDRGECDVEQLCVAPEAALADPSGFVPEHCSVAALGAEGRCLPTCLPDVQARAASLTRESCASAHLCVPCVDPTSGEATGACDTPNDPGPGGEPVVFSSCCGSLLGGAAGLCVPPELLPEGMPELPDNDCPSGDVCAPQPLVTDPKAVLDPCTSLGEESGVCLDECFITSVQALLLPRDVCALGEECVPCSELPADLAGCAAAE